MLRLKMIEIPKDEPPQRFCQRTSDTVMAEYFWISGSWHKFFGFLEIVQTFRIVRWNNPVRPRHHPVTWKQPCNAQQALLLPGVKFFRPSWQNAFIISSVVDINIVGLSGYVPRICEMRRLPGPKWLRLVGDLIMIDPFETGLCSLHH